uniref:Uncharacterized protein n=1 Tax=Rhizophora mucronata TaxID=61149 RepID=A0A2P2P199_RHIMU
MQIICLLMAKIIMKTSRKEPTGKKYT